MQGANIVLQIPFSSQASQSYLSPTRQENVLCFRELTLATMSRMDGERD